jgi:hypothetical protein
VKHVPRIDLINSDKLGSNCVVLSVENVLRYQNYHKRQLLWKQCGLSYIGTNEFGKLTSRYLPLDEEIKKLTNIQTNNFCFQAPKDLINHISACTRKGILPIVMVDIYELPFNMYYQKRHIHHTLIVSECDDKFCEVVDDAYHFVGKVPIENLLTAAQTDYIPKLSGFTLETSDIIEPTFDDFLDIIKCNIDSLLSSPSQESERIGVMAIKYFLREYSQLERTDQSLVHLYKMLSDVANSRYLYSDFLKFTSSATYGETSQFLSDLSDTYWECGQDWHVAANMMLKGAMKNRDVMYDRMLNKVNNLYNKEQHALNLSIHITKYLQNNP